MTIKEILEARRAEIAMRPARTPIFHAIVVSGRRPEVKTITAVHEMSVNILIADIDGEKMLIQGGLWQKIRRLAGQKEYTRLDQLVGLRLVPEVHPAYGWRYEPEVTLA